MITEDQLEQQALQWFQALGWSHVNGADIAPEAPASERADFRAVVLKRRFQAAVQSLNFKAAKWRVAHVCRRQNCGGTRMISLSPIPAGLCFLAQGCPVQLVSKCNQLKMPVSASGNRLKIVAG